MPLAQQIFVAVVVVAFSSLPLALFYGWIVTKGWEQTSSAVAYTLLPASVDDIHDLPKAA